MLERLEKPVATNRYIAFTSYRQALLGRKWFIFLFVAAAFVATLVAAKLLPSDYEASATIMLSKPATEVLGSSTALNQVVTGDGFLSSVISKGKLDYSIAELRDRVSAESVSGTSLLSITAADPQAGRAKRIIDLVAAQFVVEANRTDTTLSNLQAQIRQVNGQLGWLNALLKNIGAESNDMKKQISKIQDQDLPEAEKAVYLFGNYQRLSGLEDREQSMMSQKIALIGQKASFQMQLAQTGNTHVTSPAVRPTSRAAPDLRGRLLFSTVAALIASVGLAIAFAPREIEAL